MNAKKKYAAVLASIVLLGFSGVSQADAWFNPSPHAGSWSSPYPQFSAYPASSSLGNSPGNWSFQQYPSFDERLRALEEFFKMLATVNL